MTPVIEETEALLTGWGRVAPTRAAVARPTTSAEAAALLESPSPRGAIARGLGRSYGDVAQNAGGRVIDMTGLAGVRGFDAERGLLTVAAGTSLDALLPLLLPRGWFLSVTPGTRFVTIGGAIANDVHGKNHHGDGGFCDHVASFELLSPGGGLETVTPESPPDVFRATAGGLGMTGVITEAALRLLPVETSRVRVDTERAEDLDDLMTRMESGDDRYRYSVAWVDCLARGRHLGRSVITRGDHARLEELSPEERAHPLAFSPRTLGSVPPGIPSVLGRLTARAFNEVWFRKAPREERGRVGPLVPFFYPLDAIGSWNRLYGPRGFVQYQFVVPFGEEDTVRTTLERLSAARCPSFLAVLKRFGAGRGFLSFPMAGWTLAVDVPAAHRGLGELLDGLDRMVAGAGGRVYLAKDSRLSSEWLAEMYPELDRWRQVRERLDPGHVLRSDLARRLAIDVQERREMMSA